MWRIHDDVFVQADLHRVDSLGGLHSDGPAGGGVQVVGVQHHLYLLRQRRRVRQEVGRRHFLAGRRGDRCEVLSCRICDVL